MDVQEQTASLQSPLIPIAEENGVKFTKKINKHEIVEEAKKQLWLAGPLVSVNLLVNCLQVISVMCVGHLGELALSGAAMATSFATVTGYSFLIGMGSALDTYCGQAYGAKQYRMLGIHTQRAMIVLLLSCIPITLIWAKARHILVFLRQDPEISAAAGLYARFLIPCIFGYAIVQCHVRFLQAQNNVLPMMVSSGISTLSHLFTCWILVFKCGLGSKGAALANGISYWINALLLMAYVQTSPSCKNTWGGFSKEAFYGIYQFLKISIPSTIMNTLEIWSFEMMVLLSGLLPNPKLETSVMSISFNTCALAYMLPLGLGSTTSIRVSNELGSGRPQTARLAVRVALSMVAIEGILVGTALILGRNVWGYSYSKEEEVVRYLREMLLLVAISHVFDGLQSVLSGAARGCGWQKIGALVNLGAYYLIGIPIAITLAFVYHTGVKGLLMGIIMALFMQALLLWIVTLCSDWEKEVKKAADRVHISPEDVLQQW
ncbi:protein DETOXIFICATION 16-like [Quercus robur]|uniref:protein DETOXIFICATION 16-like n=1 Tax=Quercus robur TaxID=38942 RepID=UPI0021610F5A|nr:protein DETOXIFICATION 16-like [Quercus robur]